MHVALTLLHCLFVCVFQVPEFNPDPNDESAASKMLVVQRYIAKPMLINNFKFDLRIYVAVTSCVPHMRAFIHREGLTRFCTTPYEAPTNKNIDCAICSPYCAGSLYPDKASAGGQTSLHSQTPQHSHLLL